MLCYEHSAEYEGKHDPKKLEELGSVLTSLDPGDSIIVAESFSHMLNLASLAEEVQIAHRRGIEKLKKGDFPDENSATTESDLEDTFKKLVGKLGKSPQKIFDVVGNQTVDLVFTAHPTQSVIRSLLQKHERMLKLKTTLVVSLEIMPLISQAVDEDIIRQQLNKDIKDKEGSTTSSISNH